MSKQAHFIVYDATTGDIKRHGKCPAELVNGQARAHLNELVRIDEPRSPIEARTLLIEHKVVLPANATHYIRKRSATDIKARTPKRQDSTPPHGINELLTVLASKHGIRITPADLAAAKATPPR